MAAPSIGFGEWDPMDCEAALASDEPLQLLFARFQEISRVRSLLKHDAFRMRSRDVLASFFQTAPPHEREFVEWLLLARLYGYDVTACSGK